MSGYSDAEALRTGLWEQLNQLTTDASERIDRLLVGDEAYDYFQRLSSEVRGVEHQQELERMRDIIAISKRNRGEE